MQNVFHKLANLSMTIANSKEAFSQSVWKIKKKQEKIQRQIQTWPETDEDSRQQIMSLLLWHWAKFLILIDLDS